MTKIFLLCSMLALGGCEAFSQALYANAIEDYNDTRSLVRTYLGDNVSDRRWIREQCRFALQQEVAALQTAGEGAKALTLLRQHYPPVVTAKLVEDGVTSLNTPWICGGVK